ncbi:hypothetical protein, partial [Vibrio genomosp. F10]
GGGGGGIAVTVGVSIAENNIDSNTHSYIKGVNTLDSSGGVTVSATNTNDIDATSVAATSSIAGGAGGGISISGAGAAADNTIFGTTLAYVENSQVDSASWVDLNASDTSNIKAEVVAVSASLSGGKAGGIGIAIGAALASNTIGNNAHRQAVRSYVKNSGITTSGALTLDAIGNMTIESTVAAGSM